jgi:hypothetical protein
MKMSIRRGLGLAIAVAGAAAATLFQPVAAHAADLPTGDVTIKSGLGALEAGPAFNGANANLYFGKSISQSETTPKSMRFVAFKFSGNTYALCSQSVSEAGGSLSISCLDVANDSKKAGAVLVIRPFDNTPSQKWIIQDTVGGVASPSKTLRNLNSGLYIDRGVADFPAEGSRPTQQPFVKDERQEFFIRSAVN